MIKRCKYKGCEGCNESTCNGTQKCKAYHKARDSTPERKEAHATRNSSPEGKLTLRRWYEKNKEQVKAHERDTYIPAGKRRGVLIGDEVQLGFRSKQEALWALYSEATGDIWEFEPEDFYVPDMGWYTPDFRSAKFGWLEVKGAGWKDRYPEAYNLQCDKRRWLRDEAGIHVLMVDAADVESFIKSEGFKVCSAGDDMLRIYWLE